MFKSYPLRIRLTIGYLSVAMVVALAAVVGSHMMTHVTDQYQAAVEEKGPQLEALTHINLYATRMQQDATSYAFSKAAMTAERWSVDAASGEMAEYEEAYKEAVQWVDRYHGLCEDDEESQFSHQMRTLINQLADECQQMMQLGEAGSSDFTAVLDSYNRMEDTSNDLVKVLIAGIDEELSELRGDQAHAESLDQAVSRYNILLVLVAFALAVGLGALISRNLTHSVDALNRAVRAFGDGDLHSRSDLDAGPELNALSSAFNTMADDLRDSQKELVEQVEKVNAANSSLELEIVERQKAQSEREQMHRKLVESSRQAGMAEVATGVLHNVGNVLNSVNISASRVKRNVHEARVQELDAVAKLIAQHADDLAGFVSSDERGKALPGFLAEMGSHLMGSRDDTLVEIDSLMHHVEHIKSVVTTQQSYAMTSEAFEEIDLKDLIEDALRLEAISFKSHGIKVLSEIEGGAPAVASDRHALIQVLVNLFTNARHAMVAHPDSNRCLRVKAQGTSAGGVRIEVADTGKGIHGDDMTRIFQYGFTTRKDGHGFGLHSSALSIKSLGGSLTVHSDGPGRGATFAMELPLSAPMKEAA